MTVGFLAVSDMPANPDALDRHYKEDHGAAGILGPPTGS
jgi:hypothetical protein